jgi:hypothetical protein
MAERSTLGELRRISNNEEVPSAIPQVRYNGRFKQAIEVSLCEQYRLIGSFDPEQDG